MRYDFAVIGAGVSGVSAALILARHGFHVALIEAAPCIAPVVRGFVRQGLHFDTGFHYAGGLGEGDVLHRLFRYLGLLDHLVVESLDPDGFDTVRILDSCLEFRYPIGIEPLRDRLSEAFPQEHRAIDAWLREVERISAALPWLDPGAEGAADFFQGPTLAEFLQNLTSDPLLQGVLSAHCLLYGVPPCEAPFALHALVAGPYYRSAHTFQGGGKGLADAFEAELARRGVELYCGREAEAIVLGAGGAVEGVRLRGGGEIACGGCVSTLHPKTMLALLPPEAFRPVYRRRIEALEETSSACLLFGAGSGFPAGRAGGNHFLLRSPEAATNLGGPEGGLLYLTAARPVDGEGEGGFLAILPQSAEVTEKWHDSVRGRRPPEYLSFKKEMVRKMQNEIDLYFPGLAAEATWIEGATPLTLREWGNTPAGSMYGVKCRTGQVNPQPVTRVPGLYLAGQAIAAPGIMGAMVSAFMACGRIVGHESMREGLEQCR